MKKYLFFFLSCLLIIKANAQQPTVEIHYEYDDAGNRIQRHIVFIPARTASQDTTYSTQLNNHEIKIYPNPTHGMLAIEIRGLEQTSKTSIQVFDNSGKLIISKVNITNPVDIDLSHQPNGNYFMKIGLDDKFSDWQVVKME